MNIELKLLATMLYHGDFAPIIKGDLTEDHFLTDTGKILYNFITGYKRSTGGAALYPSLNTVRSRFKKIELPDPDPGDRIDNLTYETTLLKMRQDFRDASAELQIIADSSDNPVEEALPILNRLRRGTEVTQKTSLSSLAGDINDVLSQYHCGEIQSAGVPWPWPLMTKATRGIHRQEWVVIAGRPKSRKTFTALHVGVQAMQQSHARVLVFSPEMPTRQILLRCVADLCKLRYSEFKDGALNEAEEMRLLEAAELYGTVAGEDEESHWRPRRDLFGLPEGACPSLVVLKSTSRDLAWIEAQIDQYRPDIFIADSFYRHRPEQGNKNEADWKVVSYLSRGFKDMTMDKNVAGIGTHQLNRPAEKAIGDLSNMGLADAVGQDADLVLRVITGKFEGEDRSALVVLGGREVPFDGILINNKPSYDFSEVGAITDLKTVEALMKKESETEEAEEAKDAATSKKRKAHLEKMKVNPRSAWVSDLDEVPDEADT